MLSGVLVMRMLPYVPGWRWIPVPVRLLSFFSPMWWPAAMIGCAAIRSFVAAREERSGETACQLVLTPMPRRIVAAAKVLPYVSPQLLGILALLPVYALSGAGGMLSVNGVPTPFLVWPFRLFGALDSWRLLAGPSPSGIPAGVLMCLTDLGWVWVAAHWGAALPLRYPSLSQAAVQFAGRALWACCMFAGYVVGAGLLIVLPWALLAACGLPKTGAVMAVASFLLALPVIWWHVWMRRGVNETLDEYSTFDRLAMEEMEDGRGDKVARIWWRVADGRRGRGGAPRTGAPKGMVDREVRT